MEIFGLRSLKYFGLLHGKFTMQRLRKNQYLENNKEYIMASIVNSKSSGLLGTYTKPLNDALEGCKGYTVILINAVSAFAIYKNPRNPMVFCSAAAAMLGNTIAWYRNAKWTNQIASAFSGALVGALSAKFFPEQVSKVHQAVMGYFGFTFEASTESSAEVISGEDRHSDEIPEEVLNQGQTPAPTETASQSSKIDRGYERIGDEYIDDFKNEEV
ncbi:MAG: hypothetical protein IT584_02260 [Chlamydiae bacterium]|nr:hypothetical protein [Chlamydiota bacterium]